MASVCGERLDFRVVEDPYATDRFRIFEFKVRRCTRNRSHDWTDCPFAHPGEKARRRDPRRYHYSGEPCAEFRRGGECPRGDACEYAHGVFEVWLHPAKYRTEACKDGNDCQRKVCFFAHTPRELRVLDKDDWFSVASPNSTLISVTSHSPETSPPLSPVWYQSAVADLMGAMAAMKLTRWSGEQENCGGAFSVGLGPGSRPDGKRSEIRQNDNDYACPDLGWVNDLLM